MKLQLAKEAVIKLLQQDISKYDLEIPIDETPIGRDVGKFKLFNLTARVIAPFNGFFANINLDWFSGSNDMPIVQKEPFYWYVFALKNKALSPISYYYICNFHKMKEWVLNFRPTSDNDHRDHKDWRGAIEIISDDKGYFRWGDEPNGDYSMQRYIKLNNIQDLYYKWKKSVTTDYIPVKNDFLEAFGKIAQIGDITSLDIVLDEIEKIMASKGIALNNNWRKITKINIQNNWQSGE